jgi:glucosamine--fructose-6-phosphate aminotransferase (isomerizing)
MPAPPSSNAAAPETSSRRAPQSTHMFREAGEAHRAVAAQLADNAAPMRRIAERLRARPPRAVVTCGRGSSDHAATFAKYLIETRTGVLTSSAAPSVSSVYARATDLSEVLHLTISQSGRSPDLLGAVAAAKAAGAFTVALVNDVASPLAALADEVLPLQAGPEISVAATKSFIAALAGVAQLVSAWTSDDALDASLRGLPEALQRAWALDWSPAIARLQAARSLYVLGRGLGFGVAQEAALKFKETCGLHAEAFSTAEVLNGPMALVGAGFPALVFAQGDATRTGVVGTARSLAERGAEVLLADGGGAPADGSGGPQRLAAIAADPTLEPILLVQSFYRMVNALALARGFDPDRPPHLAKVTETV